MARHALITSAFCARFISTFVTASAVVQLKVEVESFRTHMSVSRFVSIAAYENTKADPAKKN